MTPWFDASIMASIRAGWMDRKEFRHGKYQSKRCKAVLKVWEKVSERFVDTNPFDTMPNVTFFVPSLDIVGQVRDSFPIGVVVYLAPTLEFNSQRDVDHTAAHEIAHVSLGHHLLYNTEGKEKAENYEDWPTEKAADELAAKWGFSKRKRGKPGAMKLVRMYADASRRKTGADKGK